MAGGSGGPDDVASVGVRAFVFTDVEGSTVAWEREPVAMADAMATVMALHDDVGEQFDGRRAVEQGAGDSAVLVFSSPSRALAAAVDLQRRMAATRWSTTEPVRIRVAVHAGEVVGQPDGTFAGPTMNRCGRLLGAAHGGQILASMTTVDLAGGPGDGVEVLVLGEHHLRGIAEPVRIGQLRAEGLEQTFPPLRTVDASARQIPRYRGPVIGQDALLADLVDLVAGGGVVTLVGTGGCGKTRLAAETAMRSIEVFRDGIGWLDLAPIGDADLVDDTAAAALGVRRGARSPRDLVLEHLEARQSLVVLDNCEHVIEAAADLAVAIRDRCPSVTVLATSREPLNVSEEAIRRVGSLPVPDGDSVAAVEGAAAGALLLDRVRQPRPDFVLGEEDAAAFAELCRRLDGIPLALELAAARLRVATPQAVVAGLTERFRLLTGGGRNTLARQRTLEASVGWSYHLLADLEAAVFRRLCVFASPFTLDQAVAMAADGWDRSEVADAVASLVDRSLLHDAGGGRLRMLETLRHFARERLLESGDADEVRDQHLAWFVGACADREARLEGVGTRALLEGIDREIDDLRAAMQWALDRGRGADVVAIAAPTVWYWILRARIPEARAWIGRARSLGLASEAELRAQWATLNLLVHHQAVHEEMEPILVGALELAGSLDDQRMQGRLGVLWGSHLGFRDPAEGIDRLTAARTTCDAAGDGFWAAYAEGSLALCQVFSGRDDLADGHIRAMEIRRRSQPSDRLLIEELTRRALVDYSLGRYDDVVDAVDAVVAALDGVSRINLQGTALSIAGWVEIERGRSVDVVERMERLLEQYLHDGELQHVPSILLTLARALLAQGRPDEAQAHLLAAWSVPELQAFVRARLWFRHDLALADLLAGRTDAAVAGFEEAVRDATESGNPQEQARARFWSGVIERRRGEHGRAEAHLHAALEAHARHGFRQLAAGALEIVGGLELDHDRPAVAARLLGAAGAVRAEAGVVFRLGWQEDHEADLERCRRVLGEAAFDEESAQGAAMGLAEAVELARRGRGERGRPTFGWDSLTVTEQRVARLLAEGRTNPEIADALLMGRETVKSHVSSILRKLDLENRTQVASAMATRSDGSRPR